VVLIVSMLGVVSISHGTSLAAFAAVLLLFLMHARGAAQASMVLAVVAILGVGALLFGDALSQQYDAIVGREIGVMERHDKGFESSFHGRGGRWLGLLAIWERVPAAAKLFGVALSSADPLWEGILPLGNMIAAGAHNDYLRVLFSSGVVGVVLYLLFLIVVLARSLALPRGERFLVWGALAVVGLFSVSLTPTLYATMQYICFAVFAYATLPRRQAEGGRLRHVLPRHAPLGNVPLPRVSGAFRPAPRAGLTAGATPRGAPWAPAGSRRP
jgi:O-antigen ligase